MKNLCKCMGVVNIFFLCGCYSPSRVVKYDATMQGSRTNSQRRPMPTINKAPLYKPGESAIGRDISINLGSGVAMEFVWVEALDGWCGKYEVTNKEFRQFSLSHVTQRIPENWATKNIQNQEMNGDRQPVADVSWYDARDFTEWISRNLDYPEGYAIKLPSKEEFLIAILCGDGRRFPWGNSMPPKFGNYLDESVDQYTSVQVIDNYNDGFFVTCPVESSGENRWGIYGLGGNVWEWTNDKYKDEYFFRGGGFGDVLTGPLRCESEEWEAPDFKSCNVGFRLYITR